jgi:hypothetical protein
MLTKVFSDVISSPGHSFHIVAVQYPGLEVSKGVPLQLCDSYDLFLSAIVGFILMIV